MLMFERNESFHIASNEPSYDEGIVLHLVDKVSSC